MPELRQRAELQLAQSASPAHEGADEAPVSLDAALEELRVHHLELELQNDELRAAHDELTEARDRYFELYDLAPIAHITLDPKGEIREANLAAAELLGAERDKLSGKPLSSFLSQEHADSLHLHLQAVFTEGGRRACELVLSPPGKAVPVLLTSNAVNRPGEESQECRSALADLSAQKQVEQELRDARDAAEASSRAKSAFLAAMSHEIRTPMNGVLGMAELLATTPLSHLQREYLDLIQDSAESLLQILNDILDFSRLEAGRLELSLRPFEIRDLVDNTVSVLADAAHQKRLELVCRVDPDAPIGIVADSLRIRQVLVNLVGNAIKFTEAGEVVVDVRAGDTAEDGRARLEFEVRDTGPGIPQNQLVAIFEPFEQVDTSSTRRYGGAGLGLAISDRLVRQMGGLLSVDSGVGRGSRFSFALLVDVAAQGQIPPRVAPAEALAGARVALVDDNETNARVLAERLAHWGMEPTRFLRARDALAACRAARARGREFYIVVTDANMPEMDGFTLAERLLTELAPAPPVVLMLSWGDRPGDVARCKRIGIDFLLKPVKHAALLSALECCMGAQDARPPSNHSAPGRPLRVLLVEDNRVNQRLVAGLLSSWGHEVIVVDTGSAAVATLSDRAPGARFDAVLMDVETSDLDGVEVTAQIRALEEERSAPRTPIFALTAHTARGDSKRYLDAGMDGHLAKPIHADALRDVLGRLVGEAPSPQGRAEVRAPDPEAGMNEASKPDEASSGERS